MKTILFLILLSSATIPIFAEGGGVIISGYLRDESNGEALIGATVYVEELEKGVVSNPYGFYSITVPKGTYTISVSYIGFKTKSINLPVTSNQDFSIKLKEDSEQIEEIVVTGEARNKNVESLDVSTEKLSIKMVKKLPAFMGEVDILKTIQLLPGIQSGGEGSSGLYVRGGGPDENLVILDEAPVYNASHLLGFFSVFNGDAIKDIELYKGGIPAYYGGKGSSVIDVRMKDGNSQRFQVDGGIGNVSSRLTIQGPVIKDKWSFILSGRRTYADILLKLAGVDALQDNSLYFYDFNGKTNVQLGKKDRLYVSAYTGTDAFKYEDVFYVNWGNLTSTIRWNHVFGQKLFSNTSLIYSTYSYNIGVPAGGSEPMKLNSEIRDYNVKSDFTWFMNPQNKVNFGFNSIHHHFEPGNIDAGEDSDFRDIEITRYNALDNAIYLSNEQRIGDRLGIQYGIRYSFFQQLGEGNVREYVDPENPIKRDTVNTRFYKKGEMIGEAFKHFEPRLSVKYTLGKTSSLKFSYNRMVQNLHLISNTNSPTPFDIWLPSSKYIKPLIVDQLVVGYFRNFFDDAIETSVELYYKDMQNALDYKDGAQLMFNEHIETELLDGDAVSYGLEILVKKQQGDFTGWIGYTLARTMRHIDGINNGDWYPSTYDRTHDVSIVLNYEINESWNVAGTWVYATGNPATYPAAKYKLLDIEQYYYSERNSYRIPDYHRLDLSVNYNFKAKRDKKFKSSLNFSLYNVYFRKNAYSIFQRENEDNPELTESVKLSIIGSMVPAITYNFNF